MKTMNLLVIFLYALAGNCFSQSPRAEVHRSNTQIIDFILDFQEKQLVDVAEAMPAKKYGFAPSGGQFNGVRTFAEQLKHIASDNYLLGAGILEEKPPRDPGLKERGPNSFKQKPRSSLTSKTPSRTCIARRPPSMMRSALFGLQTTHPGLKARQRVWVLPLKTAFIAGTITGNWWNTCA